MRERLHAYTKRTLGAGGSYNDAVSLISMPCNEPSRNENKSRGVVLLETLFSWYLPPFTFFSLPNYR
jgi:hypothetical protein